MSPWEELQILLTIFKIVKKKRNEKERVYLSIKLRPKFKKGERSLNITNILPLHILLHLSQSQNHIRI